MGLTLYNDGSRTSRVNIIIADGYHYILPGFGPLARDSDRSDESESLFININRRGGGDFRISKYYIG